MASIFPADYTKDTIGFDAKKLNTPVGYKPAPKFDSISGDFVRNGQNAGIKATGVEAWQQWCEKCFSTQRGAYRAYSTDFGIDIIRALNSKTRAEAEMILRKEITEAAMADDYKRTKTVELIAFNWFDADSLEVYIVLVGIDGATIDVTVPIKNK